MHAWTESDVIARLLGGLIVSCQADEGTPLDAPEVLAAMAAAAERGGASGIRANLPRNVAAIRTRVTVPIIGIYKKTTAGYDVYITPTFAHAREVAEAGADVIAIDATARPRPGGETVATLIDRIHRELRLPVMADIATFGEAERAAELGADLVATTLCGYTEETLDWDVPNQRLVESIAGSISVPLVVEGRVHSPEMAGRVLDWGARALVIGTAITDITWLTQRYREAVRPRKASTPC
ncbi:N-acetylmannosamine-6-phosphate 2-epimerase [Limnochorda pilosa]|uniref:Putative N-acetylmannosamine-6-phosphate 2-epimerase n=1 Tax=Limnochorda pilosa TaxID=1555112 RepID=A0A0K2SMZ7_LIMPI|nr:N-acetylmannosamine-6-phosphate 2-epimerase [Limnochorda pilosa]BAS28179.1 N-acetylmannosamine-6-phosphate 2-epimerase [Limnochorda pilosa]